MGCFEISAVTTPMLDLDKWIRRKLRCYIGSNGTGRATDIIESLVLEDPHGGWLEVVWPLEARQD